MKLSVWYPENTTSAWSASVGVADELARMGHVVDRVALKSGPTKVVRPEITALREKDAIFLVGMEHYTGLLNGAYGVEGWKKVNVPKIAWYHESAFREDKVMITKETLDWADEHFFPAAQDEEFFDQEHFAKGRSHWLPFGVDTEIFRPRKADKLYSTAFIGGVYPKRQNFLARLSRHLDEKTVFEIGGVEMRDLSGTLIRSQTRLYADNVRQIKVFVNLPAYSQHLVTKVFEVMACGTFLLTPALEGAAVANMRLFKNKEHLVYYPENHMGYLAQLMRDWSSEEKAEERERIAEQGEREVFAKHTLRHRLEEMFKIVKLEEEKVEIPGAEAER